MTTEENKYIEIPTEIAGSTIFNIIKQWPQTKPEICPLKARVVEKQIKELRRQISEIQSK